MGIYAVKNELNLCYSNFALQFAYNIDYTVWAKVWVNIFNRIEKYLTEDWKVI